MDAAVQNFSATERVLKSGMEQAVRAAFSAQVDVLVYGVRQQVQHSVNELEIAAHNIKRKVFVARWSELPVAFVLGVLTVGVFGHFQIDPELYLRQVLQVIADHPVNRIHELLPWTLAVPPAHLI